MNICPHGNFVSGFWETRLSSRELNPVAKTDKALPHASQRRQEALQRRTTIRADRRCLSLLQQGMANLRN